MYFSAKMIYQILSSFFLNIENPNSMNELLDYNVISIWNYIAVKLANGLMQIKRQAKRGG